MSVYTETLNVACERELDELANIINGEMKAIVGSHTRSGLALAAIHIEVGNMTRFVGGTDGTGSGKTGTDHLAMLDEGNGGSTIYPKYAKALYLRDYGICRGSVRPYAGIHFVHEIASRHK